MMGHLVTHGPLAVVVDALSWQDYLGGIIQHHCSSKRSNHAVLVVGYDTTGTDCQSIMTIVGRRVVNRGTERSQAKTRMHACVSVCMTGFLRSVNKRG